MIRALRDLPSLALIGLLAAGCGDGPTSPNGGAGATPQLVDLSAGELQAHRPRQDGLALALPGASGPASYAVIAQSTSRESPGFISLRLSVSGGQETGASGSVGPSDVPSLGSDVLSRARERMRSDRLVRRIRENARRELDRVGARPARRSSRGDPRVSRSSLLPTGEVPATDDTLRVWLGVESDLSVTCDTTEADTITSVVQSVGREVAILADTQIADGAMREMDWQTLADEYDASVLGVPEAYFGEATDIDDNRRVLVLFTPEVNKLTERDSETRIGGFFVPSDLADSGGDSDKSGTRAGGVCPAGNEAEIVYLLAPDPDGEFSDSVSVQTARRSGIGASPGEFEHLINAGNRIIDQNGGFNELESTWLDEGLSHLAEEVVGLKRAGLPVRDNLTLVDAIRDSSQLEAFNTFHIQNFLRARRYLINPDSTPALSEDDPQDVESLEMRGFAYLFLRWLGDQEGPAGSGIVDGSNEEQLFRELAGGSGTLARGVDNIEAATGKDWRNLLADYTASPTADDQVETDPRLQVKTWNLPSVFDSLHTNEGTRSAFPEEYPLELTDLGSPAGDTTRVEIQPGGARYFRVSAPAGDTLTVRLTAPDGSPLGPDSSSRILLFRVR